MAQNHQTIREIPSIHEALWPGSLSKYACIWSMMYPQSVCCCHHLAIATSHDVQKPSQKKNIKVYNILWSDPLAHKFLGIRFCNSLIMCDL